MTLATCGLEFLLNLFCCILLPGSRLCCELYEGQIIEVSSAFQNSKASNRNYCSIIVPIGMLGPLKVLSKMFLINILCGCRPFGRLWWDEIVPTVVTRAQPHNQVNEPLVSLFGCKFLEHFLWLCLFSFP